VYRFAALAVVVAAALALGAAASSHTATCSAAHEPTALPKQSLPAKVAAKRQAIVNAAVACDYAKLQALAGKSFTFSYGGGTSAAAYWRILEAKKIDRPLQRLVRILSLKVTRNETGSYAWPSAYTDRPTAADWNALVSGGVYTRAEVARMKAGKTYYGYRTAIRPDGRWQFFVAGD
jgi:hypothetical protein